jgi:hypothetical protein
MHNKLTNANARGFCAILTNGLMHAGDVPKKHCSKPYFGHLSTINSTQANSLAQGRQVNVRQGGAFEMEIVFVATVLAGVITGRFFKVFVLIPLGLSAAAVVWFKCQAAEISLVNYAGEVCLLIICLEAGYFAGNLLSNISLQSRKLSGFRVRPRH